jgi:hypothetical protein
MLPPFRVLVQQIRKRPSGVKMDALQAKLSGAIQNLTIANDVRRMKAENEGKPVIIIFGRVTKIDGIVEKLFFKVQEMRGIHRQAALEKMHEAADQYSTRLNELVNKLW